MKRFGLKVEVNKFCKTTSCFVCSSCCTSRQRGRSRAGKGSNRNLEWRRRSTPPAASQSQETMPVLRTNDAFAQRVPHSSFRGCPLSRGWEKRGRRNWINRFRRQSRVLCFSFTVGIRSQKPDIPGIKCVLWTNPGLSLSASFIKYGHVGLGRVSVGRFRSRNSSLPTKLGKR